MKNFYWTTNLFINKYIKDFKNLKSFRFHLKKIYPTFPSKIINESNYIDFTSIEDSVIVPQILK